MIQSVALNSVRGEAGKIICHSLLVRAIRKHQLPTMDENEKQMLNFLWQDLRFRQEHYWSSFNRFSLAIIMVNIAPYFRPEHIPTLNSLVLVFPSLGLFMAAICAWYLGGEYQRLRMVRIAYDRVVENFCQIPRMPTGWWWEKLIALPIGSSTSAIFGIGLTLVSLTNGLILFNRFVR